MGWYPWLCVGLAMGEIAGMDRVGTGFYCYRVVDHGCYTEYVRRVNRQSTGERMIDRTGEKKRGLVDGMSWDSRKRLLRLCFSLDWSGAVLLTLTALESPDYNALRAYWKRLTRVKSGLACLWVGEFQKRGARHFHLVIFGASGNLLPQAELQRMWEETLKVDLAIVDVRKCDASGALYVAKYVSKGGLGSGASLDNAGISGRSWGVLNRACLPVLPTYNEGGVVVDVISAEERWKSPGVAGMVLKTGKL